MNKDITLMIELQKYWDKVLHERNTIKKTENAITDLQNEIKNKKNEFNSLDDIIKKLKINVNEQEVRLSGIDEHIKKLGIKKDAVKTEKEITAVEHEFDKAQSDKEKIEEDLIILYDDIESKENSFKVLTNELAELEKKSAEKISEFERIINDSKNLEEKNKQDFDGKSQNLSPAVKSRFLKFINSQNGKGIAKISGEICGACNFQIPFNLIQDLLKEDSIITCTNCGRYIYKNMS